MDSTNGGPVMPTGFRIILIFLVLSIGSLAYSFIKLPVTTQFLGMTVSKTPTLILYIAHLVVNVLIAYAIYARKRFGYKLALIYFGYSMVSSVVNLVALTLSPGFKDQFANVPPEARRFAWSFGGFLIGFGLLYAAVFWTYIYRHKNYFQY